MEQKPVMVTLSEGEKGWEKDLGQFRIKAYIPKTDCPKDLMNYGFWSPYLLVFDDTKKTLEEGKALAQKSGLAQIASSFGAAVYFVSPAEGISFAEAPKNLYELVMEESAIGQYYEDGIVLTWDRFQKKFGLPMLRGTVSRTVLYGVGEAADYLAENCLKTLNGRGMFGPGDITPAVCILDSLSKPVSAQRRDLPVASLNNSKEINAQLSASVDAFYEADTTDLWKVYKEFAQNYRRMVGHLQTEPDFDKLGMVAEPGEYVVTTSKDNQGDDKGTETHKVGYMAFYNKAILTGDKKVPMVMCYHGGGDSAMFMAWVSGWYDIARKYGFLLVCVENHLNSTATEMMELMKALQEKYPVDAEKLYATGFSMGGCKSWDMYQEYPEVFAGIAPMDATFDVGLNVFGQPSVKEKINEDVLVPIYYIGGEKTPLPELPFQEAKCLNRMAYVLRVNKCVKQNTMSFDKQELWENPIWGIAGEKISKHEDASRNDWLTLHYFPSRDGHCYTVFGSVQNQGHEVRHHSCEYAWNFLNRFRRLSDGTLIEEQGKKECCLADINE